MRRLAMTVSTVALIGVCVLSRWCSELQNEIDRNRR